jgi:Rrf2 family protein
VNIALGQKADYAIRAVLELGRAGERRKSREIAAAMAIPETYLPQVLGLMVKAGLVRSTAGPDGGYSLARDPAEISVLQVVEGADGPIQSATCVLRGGPCRWNEACALHEPWFRAQQALREQLGATTLADLIERDRALEAAARRRRSRATRGPAT